MTYALAYLGIGVLGAVLQGIEFRRHPVSTMLSAPERGWVLLLHLPLWPLFAVRWLVGILGDLTGSERGRQP